MVTGLEERGYRPQRHERDLIAAYIFRKLDHEYRLVRPAIVHAMMWGVPCGPTLSMVKPSRPLGLFQLLAEQRVAAQINKPFRFVDFNMS